MSEELENLRKLKCDAVKKKDFELACDYREKEKQLMKELGIEDIAKPVFRQDFYSEDGKWVGMISNEPLDIQKIIDMIERKKPSGESIDTTKP